MLSSMGSGGVGAGQAAALTGAEGGATTAALGGTSPYGGGGGLMGALGSLGPMGKSLQSAPGAEGGQPPGLDRGAFNRATGAPLSSLDNLVRILEARRMQRMGGQRPGRSFLSE